MQRLAFALLDTHGAAAPNRVLDAGCGAGYFTERWREHGRIPVTVGLDSAAEGLRLARQRGPTLVVAGSVSVLPFAAAAFDVVHCADVLQHLGADDAGRTIAEFARVLRPAGLLLVRAAARRGVGSRKHRDTSDYQQWEPGKLRALLEPAGFRIEWMSLANWLPSLVADLCALRRPAPEGDVGLGVALAPVEGLRRILLETYWALEGALLLRFKLKVPGGHTVLCLARKT
jgi:SAM-dependent methyltransferase